MTEEKVCVQSHECHRGIDSVDEFGESLDDVTKFGREVEVTDGKELLCNRNYLYNKIHNVYRLW